MSDCSSTLIHSCPMAALLRVSGMVPSTSNSSSNSGISVDKDDVLMSDTGVKEGKPYHLKHCARHD